MLPPVSSLSSQNTSSFGVAAGSAAWPVGGPPREEDRAPGSLRIGVDLGGTKIESVLVRLPASTATPGRLPEVLARSRRPTERERGYDHIVDAVAESIWAVAKQAGLSVEALPPIGVGMPGAVTRAGVIKNSNTTCLNGRPFRADLIRRIGEPIAFANDANCFALAEATFGAGRGHEVVFGVILGTGVGGGIVLPAPDFVSTPGQSRPALGRSWNGPQGIAGEWGHVTLDPEGPPCYCGRRGCIETYLCGPALEADYARRSGRHLPLREIASLAGAEGDADAVAMLQQATRSFGRALATVINILDPDVIVLGGGVSLLPCWYDAGRREVSRWVFTDELTTPIVRHQISDSAGVLGAALLPTFTPPPPLTGSR
jgi:fructokinase